MVIEYSCYYEILSSLAAELQSTMECADWEFVPVVDRSPNDDTLYIKLNQERWAELKLKESHIVVTSRGTRNRSRFLLADPKSFDQLVCDLRGREQRLKAILQQIDYRRLDNADALRALLEAEPFTPFSIWMNLIEIRITYRERAVVSSDGNSVMIPIFNHHLIVPVPGCAISKQWPR